VKTIDANRTALEVYEDARQAMLPQIQCIVGPKASGKTTLGRALCQRTNMKLINFSDFVVEEGLTNADEETTTMALIRRLAAEITPRVLLEDFPTSEFQAKFFVKNCVAPSHIFHLSCGKDECQERMINLGQGEDGYLASSILSKRIREFNEN